MKFSPEVKNVSALPDWQKKIIDLRLSAYYQNPEELVDFDKTIDEIEKSLVLHN